MNDLKFTAEAAAQLEKMYTTPDVIGQRAATIKWLELTEGGRVLDVGCGPGFLSEEIAQIVGREGQVIGIDISTDFINLANERKKHSWVDYAVGDATHLNFPNSSFDFLACTQVAEYVSEVDVVLSEAYRVLKTNGRAVFVATDWDAVIWYSDYPDRMSAMMKNWESHCAFPTLPRTLPQRLRQSGFKLLDVCVYPITNLSWSDDTYSKGLSKLILNFVQRKNEISQGETDAWIRELESLSQDNRYFFNTSRFAFIVEKVGS